MKWVVLLLVLGVVLAPVTQAHPGNTDKYGCHTCHTNCERYGLRYSEYHCHNSGDTPQSLESEQEWNALGVVVVAGLVYGIYKIAKTGGGCLHFATQRPVIRATQHRFTLTWEW